MLSVSTDEATINRRAQRVRYREKHIEGIDGDKERAQYLQSARKNGLRALRITRASPQPSNLADEAGERRGLHRRGDGGRAPARLVIRSRHDPRWPRRGVVIDRERTLVATPAGTELTICAVMHAALWHQLLARLQRPQDTRLRRWLNERFREELEAGAEN